MKPEESSTGGGQRDWRPVPDPSKQTDAAIERLKEQFDRELAAQKELSASQLAGMRDYFNARLAAMDQANKLLADNVHRVPTDTTSQVANLREFMSMRFQERDLRNDQSSRDTKEALSIGRASAERALIEAKDGINKRFDIREAEARGLDERVRMLMPRSESEALHRATNERVAQNAASMVALNGRMDLRDERGKGVHQGWAIMIAVVSVVATIITVVTMLMSRAGS